MTAKESAALFAGMAALIMTLLQLAPIRRDPWSALFKALGRAVNADVLRALEEVKGEQQAVRQELSDHIKVDDRREADGHRERILRFNNELLRGLPHTREDFIEILTVIDSYERYCKNHSDYKNNRAAHAVANIGRVYDERLIKHDFLKD